MSVHQTWCFNQDGSISSAVRDIVHCRIQTVEYHLLLQLDDSLVLTFLGGQPAIALKRSLSHTSDSLPNQHIMNSEEMSDSRTVPSQDVDGSLVDLMQSQLEARDATDDEAKSRLRQKLQQLRGDCEHRYVVAVLGRINKSRLWSAQRRVFPAMDNRHVDSASTVLV